MFPTKQLYTVDPSAHTHESHRQAKRSESRVKFFHPMSEATADKLGIFLIRVVPLVCGGLLGSHGGHPLLGVLIGLAVAVFFDLQLEQQSLIQSWLKRLQKYCCPGRGGVESERNHKSSLSA